LTNIGPMKVKISPFSPTRHTSLTQQFAGTAHVVTTVDKNYHQTLPKSRAVKLTH